METMKHYQLPQRIIDLANEYDESKHPRAEDGKWTSTGGSGGGGKPKGLEWTNPEGERQSVEFSYKNSLTDGHTIMRGKKTRAEKARAINSLLAFGRTGRKEKYEDLFGPETNDRAQSRRRSDRATVKAYHVAALSAGLTYNRSTHQYE